LGGLVGGGGGGLDGLLLVFESLPLFVELGVVGAELPLLGCEMLVLGVELLGLPEEVFVLLAK
jgi:hypothetical protein